MAKSEPLVSPAAIAEYLDVTEAQLAQLRYMSTGPSFIKVGRRVRYRISDVDAWLAANTQTRTGIAS